MRIGVDLMGSDSSPQQLFKAVLAAQDQVKGLSTLYVFATPSMVKELSAFLPSISTPLIQFISTSQVIAMEDSPLLAVRRKKDSSLVVGMKMMAAHELDAFVSAGNTGALVASARLNMPLLEGVVRPALLALFPTEKGTVAVIDVGGNVDCRASHLIQFAQMGIAFQSCLLNKMDLKIGLLNIGIESRKGNAEIRQAYQSLETIYQKGLGPVFLGNVEGREVFQGKVDVLVTDGFTGNVFLKTSEGISQFILEFLKREFETQEGQQGRAILSKFQKTFNYDEYSGAILCGTEGIIIKCHGYSSVKGMFNAIKGAANLVEHHFITKIKKIL